MKVGHLDNAAAVAPASKERKPATRPAAQEGAEPSSKVELSSTASALSTGGADGSFDAEKVERIAQAIRDGKFEVNADAIADKLIANAQELLGRTSN